MQTSIAPLEKRNVVGGRVFVSPAEIRDENFLSQYPPKHDGQIRAEGMNLMTMNHIRPTDPAKKCRRDWVAEQRAVAKERMPSNVLDAKRALSV